jgi:carbonic anhydrase
MKPKKDIVKKRQKRRITMDKKPNDIIQTLREGNKQYVLGKAHEPITQKEREETFKNGQKPWAIVVTCSDSRVPPEYIFNVGLGDLFVIRTAGSVIGDFEQGSIEYAVEHLGCQVIIVLGHSHCGAVKAALSGHAEGFIGKIVKEIKGAIQGASSEDEAIMLNVKNSIKRISENELLKPLILKDHLLVLPALYDLETGKVNFQ